MAASRPFRVDTDLVRLSVTVADGAVTSVLLHGRATRRPGTALERRAARELVEFVRGRRRRFTVPLRAQGTPFQQRVWRELERIPYGRTLTYQDVARRIGAPRAPRAVGQANHRNPIPLIIPCHRVVAAGGGLGGYGGGVTLKQRLLELERR